MKKLLPVALLLLFLGCGKGSDSGPSGAPGPSPAPLPTIDNTIVFYRDNPNGGIYTISENGTNEKKLLGLDGNNAVAFPNWSMDHRIYFTGKLQGEANPQLYSMKEDGTDVMRITNNANVQYSRLSVATNSRLLYVKTFADMSSPPGLYTSKTDGTEETKVMDLAGLNLSDVSWYPGGSKIIYVSDEAKNANNERVSNIFLIDPNGTGKAQITANFSKDKLYDHPYICADGSRIVYTVTPDVNTTGSSVYVSNIDGSNEYLLQGAASKTEGWTSRNWTKDVQWILLADHLNQLHLIGAGGSGRKRLTGSSSLDAKLKDF